LRFSDAWVKVSSLSLSQRASEPSSGSPPLTNFPLPVGLSRRSRCKNLAEKAAPRSSCAKVIGPWVSCDIMGAVEI
jgi:hypothetical protein